MAKKQKKPGAVNPRSRIISVERVRASDIEPHPGNWRDHPEAQAEAMAGVMREVGDVGVLLAWRSERNGGKLTLIDGHLRRGLAPDHEYMVAITDLNDTEADYVLATHDPLAAMAAADAGALDALLSSVNSGEAAVQKMLSDLADGAGLYQAREDVDAEPQIDKAEELRAKWGTARGQVWRLGDHRMMCGDSTSVEDVARLMDGSVAELLFTSPPYADMREYKGDDLSIDKLAKFIPTFNPHARYQVVNLGIKRDKGEVIQYWDTYIVAAKDCGYKLLSWNVWDQGQNGAVGKLTAMFPIEHEWIFVFGRAAKDLTPTVPNKDAGNVDAHVYDRQASGKTKKKGVIKIRPMREIGTVSRVSPQLARNLDTTHPAMFPVEIVAGYVQAMTSAGHCVAEPFSGSGTTLIACEQLGRKCRAMEISPAYVAVALQRWADATGKTPELISDGAAA